MNRKKCMKEESKKKVRMQKYGKYGNKNVWIKFSKTSYSQVQKCQTTLN